MTDLTAAEAQHAQWLAQACAAVGVDVSAVDVAAIHDLTRVVAHDLARPMAPVAAFVWGMALGQQPLTAPEVLRAAIEATVPAPATA